MSNHQMFKVAGWVGGSLLVCACAGKPAVNNEVGETNHVGGGSNGSTGTTTGPNSPFSQAGTGSTGIGIGNPNGCKQTCEAGECGPVSNGCGALIECGSCTLPETCGGAGIPSHCGVPTGTGTCTPTTCEALGATCGLQSDGCGGILDCWSATAKASGAAPACEVAGNQCINGTCKSTVPECTKLTCNDYAGNAELCGPVSDGCSGVLECGFTCETTERCENSKCVAACTPLTCEQALVSIPEGSCDVVPDGCGGIIPSCHKTACTDGATCGGAGEPGVCGVGTVECSRLTAESCGSICGKIPDGCGGEVTCPTACSGDEVCMGSPGECKVPSTNCTPTTCAAEGADCGQIPDGCEGFLTCGTNNGNCEAGKTCGSGNKCVSISGCTPATQAEICTASKCGVQSAGCGDATVDCGGCPEGQSCGAGGPSLCGVPTSACVPLTPTQACAYAANSCGPQSDGCGGSVTCTNTCTWPERCTGNPTKCAIPTIPGCTNLCPYIDTTCATPTKLTGTVYAPEGTIPLYNALVYVPNAALPAITTGRSCERCEDEDLGSPIAAARTGADGTFTLNNVPAGKSFPLVIKMGKWRRVVTIPARQNCSTTALTKDQTRLPKNATTDADTTENRQYLSIPRFAVVTGMVDAMECVLKKMGVEQAEFTRPTGTGRVHMYRAPTKFVDGSLRSGGGGVMGCKNFKTGSTTQCASARDTDVTFDSLDSLFSGTNLDKYDVAVFDCEGASNDHDSLDPKLLSWANAGGRVFSSHYSYRYLNDNGTFADSAVWGGSENGNSSTTGIIDKAATNPKGAALNTWLGIVNAWSSSYGSGYMSITDPRDYVKSVNSGSERFIYLDTSVRISGKQICDANSIQQYAFNTPYNASAANICGRVLYSAFHVADVSGPSDKIFPSYCTTGALTPQEKTLMFMLFDLSACVSVGEPPSPPTCTKNTCDALGADCGSMPDGCGGLLNCGTCTAPDTCGGGGTANVCGSNCTRTTCGAQGANCGKIADGCGGILDCGTCDSPATCGGAGTPNVCGTAICTPRSCTDAGAECGYISDGCGSTVDCGDCTTGTCGGGGTPNKCATGTCTPKTECTTAKCGFESDGCGDTVGCGPCPTGATCVAGACIESNCTPRNCTGIGCGFIGDGCGGVVDCGVCTVPGQTCGGGGTPSQCGGSCDAITCDEVGAECGAISNGCGGITDCGICDPGETCGALSPNKCGVGNCVKRTCGSVNATCGQIGDGCGGVLECGVCTVPGQSCGGGGTPNQCGTGGCVVQSCGPVKCGPAADGCGGLLDCGTCPPGETCGGGGTPGVCGSSILY